MLICQHTIGRELRALSRASHRSPACSMATALGRWCNQKHTALCAVTDAVSALPTRVPQQRHPKGSLSSSTSFLEATYDRVLTTAIVMVLPTEGDSPSIEFAHAMLITDFTAILTSLIPRLTQLGRQLNSTTACSVGYAEEELFWTLWGGLVLSSSSMLQVIEASPNHWPQDRQHFHVLYPAFQSVCVGL